MKLPEIPEFDITKFTEQTEFLLTLQIVMTELIMSENGRRGYGPRATPPDKPKLVLMP